ncbi:hypothetical protein [Cupriavidus numazuensis]|uniref:hypothetical protein n=1 Tax=Cupriavidus numazuensis TaxID=221992 RepID=UPI001BAB45A2|nr:hypothetical protein [Cupriavidus numazuensis]
MTISHHAEKSFREAFERLKLGIPERLPPGSKISQNNVAREAGCDASALKKARFPSLIAEIQQWNKDNALVVTSRQLQLSKRRKRITLVAKISELKAQRDHLASLLVEADAKILELRIENERMQALVPKSNVYHLR